VTKKKTATTSETPAPPAGGEPPSDVSRTAFDRVVELYRERCRLLVSIQRCVSAYNVLVSTALVGKDFLTGQRTTVTTYSFPSQWIEEAAKACRERIAEIDRELTNLGADPSVEHVKITAEYWVAR
jgi:hypothetical protein